MNTAHRLEHDWFPHPLPACVDLGDRSWLYSSFAFVHCRATCPHTVRVGCDSGVYHGTFFELGPEGEVRIGDLCTLVGAIICTNGRVSIGDYCFLAHEVVLADSFAAVPPGATRQEPPSGTSSIELGENCWVGMGAVLLNGTRLGEGCVVGAGAIVDFAAPAHSILAGSPARVVGSTHRSGQG